MGSFGDRLRREREMRGISLEEIASATKIGTRSLRALEEEQFNKLPGGIFNKGFVRAYAKFLGIDEEQAVTDYLAAAGEEEEAASPIDPEQLTAAREAQKRSEEQKKIKLDDEPSGIPWGALALLVVVLAAVGFGWRYYNEFKARRERPAEQTQIQQQRPPAPAVTPPAQTAPPSADQSQVEGAIPESTTPTAGAPQGAGAPSTTAVPTTASDTFVVALKAKAPAWVSISADGQNKLSKVLTVNEEQVFRAKKEIKLTVGNAGGIEVSWNGKPQGPVGSDGQIKHLTFTQSGMQQ